MISDVFVFFSGRASERFPWRGPDTLLPGDRCHTGDSRTGSSEPRNNHTVHCGGSCLGGAVGQWLHTRTKTSKTSTHTRYIPSRWPVGNPGADRRDRPAAVQHRYLGNKRTFKQQGNTDPLVPS